MATRKRKGPPLEKNKTKKRKINTSNGKSNVRQSNRNQRRGRRVVHVSRRRRPRRRRHIQAPRKVNRNSAPFGLDEDGDVIMGDATAQNPYRPEPPSQQPLLLAPAAQNVDDIDLLPIAEAIPMSRVLQIQEQDRQELRDAFKIPESARTRPNVNGNRAMALQMQQREQQMTSNGHRNGQRHGGETKQIRRNVQQNVNQDLARALQIQEQERQTASNAQIARQLEFDPRLLPTPPTTDPRRSGGETKQIRRNVQQNVNQDLALALQMQEEARQMASNAQIAQQLANRQNPQRLTAPRGTTRRRHNTDRPLRGRPNQRQRRGVGTGGIISGMTGLATRAVGYINTPFSALWRAFTGCRRQRGTDVCELPGKRSDLPPVEILAGADGFPFLNAVIPGTRFTFQQLRDAMAPNYVAGRPRARTR